MNIKNMFKNLVARVKAYFVKKAVAPTPAPLPSIIPEPVPTPVPVDVAPAPTRINPPNPNKVGDGFFLVDGITNSSYQGKRFQIKELSDALPAGSFPRASAQLNLAEANGEWKIAQFIGVGVVVEEYPDDVTGGTAYRIKQPVENIVGTFSWPDAVIRGYNLATVAGVVGYVNTLV